MTVLPDAPIDPATGLPVPTIAVATDGGVSVITDSGAVYDSATTFSFKTVDINEGILFFTRTAGASASVPYFAPMPITSDGFSATTYRSHTASGGIPVMKGYPDKVLVSGNGSNLYAGSITGGSYPGGLTHLAHRSDDYLKSMVAYTTSTYNTGWMNGDIKGAFLSDTDDTDLVGSGELVTNGTFDTDVSGWTEARGNGTLSWDAGRAKVVAAGAPDVVISQAITGLTTGSVYCVSADIDSGTMQSSARLRVSTNSLLSNDNTDGSSFSGGDAGSDSVTFVATQSTHYVGLFGASDGTGDTAYLDNISVKLADADRSVNG
jgi:hypothetical protein